MRNPTSVTHFVSICTLVNWHSAISGDLWYNVNMETGGKKIRKSRSDRNHILYQLVSPTGKTYLGVTFVRGRAYKGSLQLRWEAHLRNALQYNLTTLLSSCIREEGPENFERKVLRVVRGKQNAHNLERQLIAELRPELNMEGMKRKTRCKKSPAEI